MRQHGAAVLRPFALAYQNFMALEIHVLGAQAHALHQPHAGAVQQAAHQPMQTGQLAKQSRYFRLGQHHGQTLRPPGPFDSIQPRQFDPKHLLVKEKQRRQGLVLGSRRDMAMHRERG